MVKFKLGALLSFLVPSLWISSVYAQSVAWTDPDTGKLFAVEVSLQSIADLSINRHPVSVLRRSSSCKAT